MIARKMRAVVMIGLAFCGAAAAAGCSQGADSPAASSHRAPGSTQILFLHHSTGECVWNGGVRAWFEAYNQSNQTAYEITEQNFPKDAPYGWSNYPYDYWNIWVRHGGDKPFQTEPTLEMLTPRYNVIVFKHCFPVSAIEPDTGHADVASEDKRIENYKLQYAALKQKLREFPQTKFLLWTGAALVEAETDQAAASRAKAFFDWVRGTWDEPGDNIYLWDFRTLETGGGLYLKADCASGDSHPNEAFSKLAAPLFCQRLVDVIKGTGDSGGAGKVSEPAAAEGLSQAKRPSKAGPVREAPAATAPRPPAHSAPDSWVFDNAEDPAREKQLWGQGAAYGKEADGNAIRIRFAAGKEEDWGDYGRQRIVLTTPPQTNYDLAPYRYAAFRVRANQDMELIFTLVTKPASLPRTDESYFGFTAYVRPGVGDWKWIALDLTKLEPSQEGETAYAAAGKPARPNHLTQIRLVTSSKHENAECAIDDIAFYRVLPESLSGKVQAP